MATRRKGSRKRATGRRRAAPRRGRTTRTRRAAAHGTRVGAREARREEVARAIETPGAPDLHVAAPVLEPLRVAEPAPAGGEGVPGYARLIAGEGDGATAREAQAELSRRRRAAEREAAAHADRPEDIPGFRDIGVELALGALRLARTLVTAPLRIGLAFLRAREL
jgi:hypothetical protein